MKYDKKTIMDEKLNAVRAEIKEISDKYNQDMATYIMREKYLKASVTHLLFSCLLFSTTSSTLKNQKSQKNHLKHSAAVTRKWEKMRDRFCENTIQRSYRDSLGSPF